MKCLYCDLPIYCKKLCRKHYKKQNALKNGTYKKLYEKHKNDLAYMEKKRMWDRLYIERKKKGLVKVKEESDSLVNHDWRAYWNNWRKNNLAFKQHLAIKNTIQYSEIRTKVIEHYSKGKNCCARCGIGDMRVLDLDHINNDGAEQRKKVSSVTYWVYRNNFPEGYQVLCRNCNWVKEIEKRMDDFEKKNITL